MTDETSAPAGGEGDTAPVIVAGNAQLEGDYSPEQAFDDYVKKSQTPAESAAAATADTESPAEGDAAPAEQVTGETQEGDPPEMAPLDLPRSWTKEQAEHWNALPRATQEYLSERASKDSETVRRSQNEAADARKAADVARVEAEQVRKKYEEKLPLLEKKLQTVGPFADIQSMADLKKMQEENPFRFQEYQLYTWEQAAEQKELQDAEGRKQQERIGKRNAYEAEQNKLLADLVPEMADTKKASEMREQAVSMLENDFGLKTELLQRWMQDDVGHEILSNAGFQKLIADQLKLKAIKAAPLRAIPKPVPAVQRPGVAALRGNSDVIQASRSKLSSTGSVDDAYALYQAKQKARA